MSVPSFGVCATSLLVVVVIFSSLPSLPLLPLLLLGGVDSADCFGVAV